MDKVFIQITTPDGKEYKVCANGKISGFPEGSSIRNRVWPHICALKAKIHGNKSQHDGVPANDPNPSSVGLLHS